jgi:hypothetical protein
MSYTAGAKVRSTVTFVPETGNTALGNVTARVIDAAGSASALTPATTASPDQYTADISIPDGAIAGPWSVRWECSSPKIVVEVGFDVVASAMSNP